MLRIKKPRTHKGKKILLAREAQLVENSRYTLFLEGRKCSGDVKKLMKDLQTLSKPLIKVLNRQNDITPFENPASLEFLTQRNDCAMFAFGSSSKKRPNNLILGRIFENEILDMVELGLMQYKAISDFKNDKIATCVKPCLVFNGPKWSHTDELRRLRSLLIDAFQKDTVEHVRLQGIEHVLSFTCTEDMRIFMRSYKILLKKSGERTPRIELTEIGPAAEFSVRRSKIASEDLFKQACKQPKEIKSAAKKNMTIDNLGNTLGRVHLGKQELGKIQTRRVKGLKKSPEEKRAAREQKKELLKTALMEMAKSKDN